MSATMNYKSSAVLCAFFALAYSEAEFQTTNSSNITGKSSPEILAKLREQLHNYAGSLSIYLCLLRKHSNNQGIGTGYLVTAKTLISPTLNFEVLKNGESKIFFYPALRLSMGKRRIGFNKPYDGLLSVAHFFPPIEDVSNVWLPRKSIFPKEYPPAEEYTYMTIGFSKNFRSVTLVPITIISQENNLWFGSLTLKNRNPDHEYYPRIGDVLVTNAHLLGMLTEVLVLRKFISANYYYFSYPPDNYLKSSRFANTSIRCGIQNNSVM